MFLESGGVMRSKFSKVKIVLLVGATMGVVFPGSVFAGGVQTLQPVEVVDSAENLIGSADSSTEGTVTAKQLANRPLLRTGELLETVPGLWISQHSGEGKANQYYLRGINLDHGTDLATTVQQAEGLLQPRRKLVPEEQDLKKEVA
jgi:hypothetical protein